MTSDHLPLAFSLDFQFSKVWLLSALRYLFSTIPAPISVLNYSNSTIPAPIFQLHYPSSTIPAPLSKLHYSSSTISAQLFQLHYPSSTIPAPLSKLHYSSSTVSAQLFQLHYLFSTITAPLHTPPLRGTEPGPNSRQALSHQLKKRGSQDVRDIAKAETVTALHKWGGAHQTSNHLAKPNL